jgi:MFS family permease
MDYSINYSNEFTLENWIIKYQMICASKDKIATFGSLILFGFFFGSVFFVRIGDKIGRKPVVLVSTVIATLSLIMCQFLSPTVTILYISIFIFGLTIGPRCLLSYVLACEMTPKEVQSVYTSFAMFVDSACMISLGLYFNYIKSMKGLMIAMIIINIILCVLIWTCVPESPKFLYEKDRKEEFVKSLQWIAKVNGNSNVNFDEIMALDMQ